MFESRTQWLKSQKAEKYILVKKILIAEDNPTVGETFTQILSSQNYHVIWVKDGQEALEWYSKENHIAKQEGKKPFDLVIMDFAMPKMNGIDTVKGMLMLNPLQRIVFCTAYGRDLIKEVPEFEKNIEILEKPISLKQLLSIAEGNYATTIREKEADEKIAVQNSID